MFGYPGINIGSKKPLNGLDQTIGLAGHALTAGTLDDKKIRDYLRSHKFDLPYGKGITFDSRGLPPPYCFAGQTKGGRQELVWPKEVATTKFIYPRPAWSK